MSLDNSFFQILLVVLDSTHFKAPDGSEDWKWIKMNLHILPWTLPILNENMYIYFIDSQQHLLNSPLNFAHKTYSWNSENNVLPNCIMKMTDFFEKSPCNLVELYRRFRRAHCLHHHGTAPMKDAFRMSETSVYFNETTRRYMP
jgi:hypothetical protein